MMPEKPEKLQPVLVGGLIIGVLSAVPFLNLINCVCCAGVLLGGFLAVMMYKNAIGPGMPALTSNDAIVVGALAGLTGAVVGTVLEGLILLSFGNVMGETMFEFLMGIYEGAEVEVPAELYDQLREALLEESIGFGWLVLNLVVGGILYAIFGLLGGLLGYAAFKPKAETPPSPVGPAV